MTDNQIEQEIQAKGLTAPRITQDDVEAAIASEFYFRPHEAGLDALRFEFLTADHGDAEVRQAVRELHQRMGVMSASAVRQAVDALMALPGEDTRAMSMVTFCVLILKNGHRIVGVNEGPVSAENFDTELGREFARQRAVDEIWPLLGYELRSKLAIQD